MKKIINKTPHTINLMDENLNEILNLPSEGEARATTKNVRTGEVNGTPIFAVEYGEPTGLPEPIENTFYVVSRITAESAKAYGRTTEDLLLTNDLVRDEQGRIVGCKSFAQL